MICNHFQYEVRICTYWVCQVTRFQRSLRKQTMAIRQQNLKHFYVLRLDLRNTSLFLVLYRYKIGTILKKYTWVRLNLLVFLLTYHRGSYFLEQFLLSEKEHWFSNNRNENVLIFHQKSIICTFRHSVYSTKCYVISLNVQISNRADNLWLALNAV